MLDQFHIPTPYGNAEVFTFVGSGTTTTQAPIMWQKPRGKSMIDILIVGSAGSGGSGAVGAASTASGGGGGGSGSQTRVTMPIHLLPDVLYLWLPGPGVTSSGAIITISPDTTAANRVAIGNAGGNGGNASGATAGTAGAAASAATAANMPLGWAFATALAGQAGGIITTSAGAVALPTTGLLVTGGGAGAALGAAGSTGTAGGNITGSGVFPTLSGGAAEGSQTTPAGDGSAGYRPVPNLLLGYGGSGGGSTGGAATGAGLYAGKGGNGAPGCGGGGGGGGFTGSTQGTGGLGGPAYCVITVW